MPPAPLPGLQCRSPMCGPVHLQKQCKDHTDTHAHAQEQIDRYTHPQTQWFKWGFFSFATGDCSQSSGPTCQTRSHRARPSVSWGWVHVMVLQGSDSMPEHIGRHGADSRASCGCRFSDLNLRPLLYNFKCKVVDRSQLQVWQHLYILLSTGGRHTTIWILQITHF